MGCTILWIVVLAVYVMFDVFLPKNLAFGTLTSWAMWAVIAIGLVVCVLVEVIVAVIHAALRARRRGETMLSFTPGNIWKMHSCLAQPVMHEPLISPKNSHRQCKPQQAQAEDTVSFGALPACFLCVRKCTGCSISNNTAMHFLVLVGPVATLSHTLGALFAMVG